MYVWHHGQTLLTPLCLLLEMHAAESQPCLLADARGAPAGFPDEQQGSALNSARLAAPVPLLAARGPV